MWKIGNLGCRAWRVGSGLFTEKFNLGDLKGDGTVSWSEAQPVK